MSADRPHPHRNARVLPLLLVVVAAMNCSRDETRRAVTPWHEIAETAEARFSLDTSRIAVRSDFVSVWLRVDFAEVKMFASGGRYRTTLIQQDLKCRDQLGRSRQMNAFLPGEDSTQFLVFPDTAWKGFREQQLEEVYSRGACLLLQRLGR